MLGDPDRDLALRTIELRLRLEHIERRVQRRRAGRIPGPLVILLPQPGAKALAAQRPGFSVAIDDEIGKCRAVGRMEQPGGARNREENSMLLTVFDRHPSALRKLIGALAPPMARVRLGSCSGSVAGPTGCRSCPPSSRVCFHSLRATLTGSMPAACHQARSLPTR